MAGSRGASRTIQSLWVLARQHNGEAEALRVLDRLGTLEEGKLADVIVVDGNPLDDMAAMRNVWLVMLVMKEGTVQVRAAQVEHRLHVQRSG